MCGVLEAVAVAGLGMSVMGQQRQAAAARAQANYQAQVQRNNEIIANRRADQILAEGQEERRRRKAQIGQLSASQTASLAAQGVDVTTGSAVDLLADTAALGEVELQEIDRVAELEAYNMRVQAQNYASQAGLFDAQARNSSGTLSSAGRLLTGAADIGSRIYERHRPAETLMA